MARTFGKRSVLIVTETNPKYRKAWKSLLDSIKARCLPATIKHFFHTLTIPKYDGRAMMKLIPTLEGFLELIQAARDYRSAFFLICCGWIHGIETANPEKGLQVVKAVCEVIETNPLQTVHIKWFETTENMYHLLLSALAKATSLQHLSFDSLFGQPETAFFDYLKSSNITSLKLSTGARLSDEIVRTVVQAPNLKKLTLFLNLSFSDALYEALPNSKLRTLKLKGFQVQAARETIAEKVRELSTTIEKLYIEKQLVSFHERTDRRIQGLTALLLGRKFISECPFHQDFFPSDLFKLIVRMCDLDFSPPPGKGLPQHVARSLRESDMRIKMRKCEIQTRSHANPLNTIIVDSFHSEGGLTFMFADGSSKLHRDIAPAAIQVYFKSLPPSKQKLLSKKLDIAPEKKKRRTKKKKA